MSARASDAEIERVPPRRDGPLDEVAWPDRLQARVVTTGPAPRMHGYDVERDLARHYTWVESMLLLFNGALPSAEQARAFEIALHFLAPAPVSEAPAHAAVVARICNVFTSALVGTAAIALAEQARQIIEGRRPAGTADLGGHEPAPDEGESIERLRQALAEAKLAVTLPAGGGRMAALLAVLRFAGLERAEQHEAVIVLARLPAAIAEAFATPAHSYRDYPVQLPDIRYEEP